MADVLVTALEAMRHDLLVLKQSAQNLSALSVPGAQAQHLSPGVPATSATSEFRDLFAAGAAATANDPANNPASATKPANSSPTSSSLITPATPLLSPPASAAPVSQPQLITDTGPGTLKPTGQALDLALTQPGYFEIQTPDGVGYARRGDFQRDGRGRLVTGAGYPVLGTDGEILLSGATPLIDATGRLFENGKPVAQLKLMTPSEGTRMNLMPDGLMRALGEMQAAAPGTSFMRQGFLENSNVVPAREMLDMTQTVRHFESMQKMIQGYDEMMGIALRKLGEF